MGEHLHDSNIRIPLWMVRGIYDIGKSGWLEESLIEGIWIPGDFQRNHGVIQDRQNLNLVDLFEWHGSHDDPPFYLCQRSMC